jgi:hypothetical protein
VLERHVHPIRHGAPIIDLERGAAVPGIFLPIVPADQLRASPAHHAFRRGVDVGEAPVLIERQKAVIDAGQNTLGALLRHLGLAAQLVFDTHGFAAQGRHVEIGAHAGEQLARAERLGEIGVCAGRQAVDLGFFAGACRQQKHRRIAKFRSIFCRSVSCCRRCRP